MANSDSTTPHFTPQILHAIRNGVLIISGSRSIKSGLQWASRMLSLAEERGWAVAIGDASGVDSSVLEAWLHIRFCNKIPLIVLGCEQVGMRFYVHAYPKDYDQFMTQLIPGGTRKSCFVIRDKALAELGALAPKAGFAGLWDGYSKGTQHTARFCRDAGIPGFIQKGMVIVERWDANPITGAPLLSDGEGLQ